MSKFEKANRLRGTEKNVWVEFGQLNTEHKSLNLGQGFPDFKPPAYIAENLCKAANSDNVFLQQYTRSFGHPRLVNALAKLYSPLLNQDLNPMTEVLVSSGAYMSLFYCIQGFMNPGDEAIIIEPFFDCYEPMVRVAGGTPIFIPLRPPKTGGRISSADWKLDPKELESKFNEKTKIIIVNTPHNPTGKMFSMSELEMIADLCKKHDVICIADEVYEWLVYPGNKHIKMATLPGMWERTVTIGSAGKTFSVTGWKMGWSVAPANLINALSIVHQHSAYTCCTPLQETLGASFEFEIPQVGKPECYFQSLPLELLPKRDRMADMLESLGMTPTIPEGGYFMMANYLPLNISLPDDGSKEAKDFKFCKWMIKEKKLGAIPPSAFHCQAHQELGEDFVRLCFIKNDETLDKAEKIFKDWKASM